jgi:glycosyltransferase 2 family protein
MHSATRRTLLTAAKLALAMGILTYLIVQANQGILRLRQETILWKWLLAGMFATFAAVTLSWVRWHLLIRALGISIRLVDTLKLGALGLALNFVSLGSIGGDFFKAIFLAHGQSGRRTEAVATVIIDRVVGLLTMMILASGGILAGGVLEARSATLRAMCQTVLMVTIVSWSGVGLLLAVPSLTGAGMRRRAEQIGFIGPTLARLLGALQAYREQKGVLLSAVGLSAMGAVGFISSYYLVARGLPLAQPTWTEHFMIVPVSGLVAAIPITPSGLGTLELAVEELYRAVPGGANVQRGDGTLVALARRLTEMAVALVGLAFYLTHRREVDEVYAEAEEAADTT